MQHKRREIVEILKQRGHATVEELSKELKISSVTVRHHLDVLRSEGMVSEPVARHRKTSGRPQHVYALMPKANDLFPHRYDSLAQVLLDEIKQQCDHRLANVIFEGAAARLAADAPHSTPGESMEARGQKAVEFLNQCGYVAHWERQPDGILIHTCNCPYDGLAEDNPELCSMDLSLMANLMGIQLQRVCHITEGDASCAYLAPIAG
ncbi:MAG TPA: ArsR family transcriptional regulator [Anaerolineales bacterium]|nr:ArsR family transcriptional regulator [Anaerolineales bacterium]